MLSEVWTLASSLGAAGFIGGAVVVGLVGALLARGIRAGR